MILYDVFVVGDPKGQPRPRAFARKGLGVRVYDPGTAEGWKSQIALAFPRTIAAHSGPVSAWFDFVFQRPKSHFRPNGSLLPRAPRYHVHKPDADNLAKAALDALTTIGVWTDDAQVAMVAIQKRYADLTQHERSGCRISITTLDDPVGAPAKGASS
jgi:Holliday junction resolvase RusA-like endonuclease